jgi:alpha-glucosidase
MLLYQGDELGLPDGEVPFERLRDPASRRFFPDHLQRDGSRTPMPWDSSSPNAGFSAGRPWLPVGPLHPALSVDRQERDADSTLHWTRRLIDLRRNRPVLRRGSMRFLDLQEPLLGIERADPADRVLCLFNVSASPIAVDLPELEGAVLLAGQSYSSSSGTRANLGAFGFCIAALPPGTSKDARHPVDP